MASARWHRPLTVTLIEWMTCALSHQRSENTVVTSLFSATLTGSRCVFGLKFRPGGFHPFIRRPVAALTNRTVRLAETFPGADEPRLQDFAAAADGRAIMAALEGLLCNAAPTLTAPSARRAARRRADRRRSRDAHGGARLTRLRHRATIAAALVQNLCRGRPEMDDPAVPHQGSGRSHRRGERRRLGRSGRSARIRRSVALHQRLQAARRAIAGRVRGASRQGRLRRTPGSMGIRPPAT